MHRPWRLESPAEPFPGGGGSAERRPTGVTLSMRCSLVSVRIGAEKRKNRLALAPFLPQHPPMLARVLSAAVNGIEAFPFEVEVHSGWVDKRRG
jgi:hypothetical protein